MGRLLGLILTIILMGIITFRLYTIGRIIDFIFSPLALMVMGHREYPLMVILLIEATVELWWLWCFVKSLLRFARDEELKALIFCRGKQDEREQQLLNFQA